MHLLDDNEKKILNDYWNFIELFKPKNTNNNNKLFAVEKYRKELITKIRENYTANQFYKYEKILNKLLWNLLELVKFNIDDLKIETKLYDNEPLKLISSCSHKINLYDEKNNKKYYFRFYKKITQYNIINKIFYIMSDKKLYNKIIKNKNEINNIKFIETYYYPFDYPFPNVNLIFYNENKRKLWIDIIKKLYFNNTKSKNNINIGWYNVQ